MLASPWSIAVGAVFALALTAFMRPVGALVVTDPATGQIMWQAPASPGETLTIEYVNEEYDTPVEERYQVESLGRLVLREVAYGSLALTSRTGWPAGQGAQQRSWEGLIIAREQLCRLRA